jgi:hypothetical protein
MLVSVAVKVTVITDVDVLMLILPLAVVANNVVVLDPVNGRTVIVAV